MTKRNAKVEAKATETVEVAKENMVDEALRQEIDAELGVPGTGEQPVVGIPLEAKATEVLRELLGEEPRLGSKENPLPDLTEGKVEQQEVRSVYLSIPLPTGRRRYSKRREEYKDWPVGLAREFKDFKSNPVNAVLYPLTDDGWKFQSQKQEKGTVEGTFNYIVWRKA